MEYKPETENALEYAERASYSIFGIIFGIIFIIAAPIVLISNEITNIVNNTFWTEWRNWIMRITGFLLFFFGFRMAFYIINLILSIFPYLKPSFAFLNYHVTFLMSVITTLIIISLPWLFYEPLIAFAISVPMVIVWIYMRKIKARHKAELKSQFQASGDNKLSEVDRIIDTTYTDIETTVNKNKERIKKVVNKFK